MKQYTNYFLLVLLAALPTLFGCSDWLDVKPIDQILEKDIYKTERGINNVLNGIYMKMAGPKMYGEALTTTVADVLGQYYIYDRKTAKKHKVASLPLLGNYEYKDEAMTLVGQVWSESYNAIFSINNFIANINDNTVLSQKKKNILLGEAYGLRAFIHFDLFRLFGPVYKEDPEEESIPYNQSGSANTPVNMKASLFIDKLLEDIATAEKLLESDPIITDGILDQNPSADENSYLFRNRRMNYYALKALKARVLQYKGNHSEAAIEAQSVINSVAGKGVFFTPTKKNQVVTPQYTIYAIESGNYIAYNDVIFGIDDINSLTTWLQLTYGSDNSELYVVLKSNIENLIFNTKGADFSSYDDIRTRQWKQSIGDMNDLKSWRYDIPSAIKSESPIRNFLPLIRLSEMYYIEAENYLEAANYSMAARTINNVLKARGRVNTELQLSEDSDKEMIENELKREYYREFYGEGQVFYYHKRRNETQIINGADGTTKIMSKKEYVVPIPKVETDVY